MKLKYDKIMAKENFSLFPNVKTASSKTASVDELVRLVKYDSNVEANTAIYRKSEELFGKEKADEEVKRPKMQACSVAVLFDGVGRKSKNVLSFTGYAFADFDHITDVVEAMKVACADEHTFIAFRSISGHGLHIIYRYECENPETRINASTWTAAFLKGNEHYAKIMGHEYDPQCKDFTRLCGLAHDASVYVNKESTPFAITDDDILSSAFVPGDNPGKERSEDPTNTHSVSVEQAAEHVEKTLLKRHITYEVGQRHNYVMHAAFLFNRYGVDIDELLEWAAQTWSDYPEKERDATIRSCYRRESEHGTWRLNRAGRKTGENKLISLPEIREWLANHVEVVYNLVTDMSQYRLKDGPEGWVQVDDREVCSLRSRLAAETGKRVIKSDLMDILRSDFSHLMHPVREYIEALPPWDGKDRIAELFGHVSVVAVQKGQSTEEAHELLLWAGHKWLVGSVAMWMSDHAINHQILVFTGPQGIYKSTFFRFLLPPVLRTYYIENNKNSFSSKDDRLALAENCIVEIEEIDMQNPQDVSELKALATSEKVKERRPYAHFREEKRRLAAFCGSGNQDCFLIDETGNRRWLCFKVSHIDDPREWGLDYDQLYAQLRDEWRDGFTYWFNRDDELCIERQNEVFRVESDEEQLIRTHLRIPREGEKPVLMNATSVAMFINGGVLSKSLSSKKISSLMKKLGYKHRHGRNGTIFEVYQLLPTDVQAALDEQESQELPI